MRKRLMVAALTLAVFAAACGGGDDEPDEAAPAVDDAASDDASDDEAPEEEAPPSTTSTTSTTTTTTTPPPPEPVVGYTLVPAGEPEVVFDWSEDRCKDLNLPDAATRAVRNTDGLLQLYISNTDTYRMTGPDFDSLTIDCSTPAMTSDYDGDPSAFNDSEWITSTYTVDNETVYAIIHNEYLGQTHGGQCADNTFFNCIDVSLTLGVSTDGGATFRDAVPAPGHLIATMPYRFDENGLPTGLWQTSNLVDRGDGYLYMLVNVSTYPIAPDDTTLNWICALRTDDITDPGSWRYWDGEAFEGVFVNPYTTDVPAPDVAETCTAVDEPALSGELSESIVWSETLQRYIIVGGTFNPTDRSDTDVYYSTSEDLIDWSPRRQLIELPVPGDITLADTMEFVGYPILLDHDSPSPNFDTVDDSFHLYVTRFNAGTSSLDRDLLRYPIEIVTETFEPTVFEFETDAEGWFPENDIAGFEVVDGALAVTPSGSDPYFTVGGLVIPDEFGTLTVTMAVDGGDDFAQLFFLADDFAWFEGPTQVGFDVIGDGEMRTYEVNLSTSPTWRGPITALRFDPVTNEDRTVRIDRIAIEP